jgi:glycerol-3-phosphate acyltransferase PlsY
MSSIIAGLVFVAVHASLVAGRGGTLWDQGEWPMSAMCVGIMGLLIFRHRSNFGRIVRGVEPKVSFRRRKPPAGRVRIAWLLSLGALGFVVAVVVAAAALRPSVLDLADGRALVVVDRKSTGEQRAERVVFVDDEQRIAVACPRYRKVVIYRVDDPGVLIEERRIEIDGRPVGLFADGRMVFVLQRPWGDARHLEPGFLQRIDSRTGELGRRMNVGWDPDDAAVLPGGKRFAVALSGCAEGETNRPKPSLRLYQIVAGQDRLERLSELTFDGAGDDPERVAIAESGTAAVVTLRGSNEAAAIEIGDRGELTLLSRTKLPILETPYLSLAATDRILMPVAAEAKAHLFANATDHAPLRFCIRPERSALEVYPKTDRTALGKLELRIPGQLGEVRPTDLDLAPRRGYVAVSNRSGTVHLIAIRESRGPGATVAATIGQGERDQSRR